MTEPTRLLPVRKVTESSSRISQYMEDILPAIKRKIFTPHGDKFRFSIEQPFDVDIAYDSSTKRTTYRNGVTFYLSETTPEMFYLGITSDGNAHALLCIYFPSERTLDIVSTYKLDIVTIESIQHILTFDSPIVVNDVACLSVKPMKTRLCSGAYDLQAHDTAEIGWCVSWMVKFSEILASKSKEEFWSQPWSIRRGVYKQLYDSFVSVPNFNSMEAGKTNWNSIIQRYNAGGRHRKTKRTKKGKRTLKNGFLSFKSSRYQTKR